MIRHVIWDWNGTLLDDAQICAEVLSTLCDDHGVPNLSLEDYQHRVYFPLRECYEDLGFQLDDANWKVLSANFLTRYEARRSQFVLREDARQVLQSLASAGLTQSILSAHMHDELMATLKHFEIDTFFTEVSGVRSNHGVG